MVLDKNTFGDSQVAIVMSKIINEKNLSPRKPARLLNRFNKIISDLKDVNLTTSIHLINLVYHESIEKCNNFEEPLNTYTKNILSGKYKEWQITKNTR